MFYDHFSARSLLAKLGRAQIHMKSLPKLKSGQIGVDSNIAQNHTSSIYNVIYGHYLPQFTWQVNQNQNLV